ncbi:DUF945 family protein, partial [Aquabacterium sp.]|uniref:DUF945 family protein n=1 Tax=Aquabacterium sp. TaxID=1872578 RepID=UPI0025C311E3
MNKTIPLLAGGTATVAVIALGALPFYTSRQVESRLTALTAQPMHQGDVMLRNLKHEAGILHSKGAVDMVLRDHCSLDPDEADGATVHITYEFSHLPGLGGINGFSWKATPTGPSVEAFSRLFSGNAELTGQGRIAWSGLVSSEMKLPAMAYVGGGETIEVAPSEGTLAFGDKPLRFDWALERVVLRGKGDAMELKQLGIQLNLSDRQRGIGKVALKVGGFSNSLFAMEGISLTSDTSEHGDKLDSVLTQRIDRLRVANQDMKDLVVEAALKGVHAASVETLTTLVGSSCGIDRLTRDESDKARQALKTLINGGMSMGISRLSGQSAQGSVDGQLMLQLKANAKPETVALAQQLSSTGELSVKGGLLDAQQKLMAVSTGYVSETPEGIKAAYSYEGGLLKVNGKTLDAGWLQAMLTAIEVQI